MIPPNSRIGRFFVSQKFLTASNVAARRLMDRIIVLEAKYDWMRNGVEYVAFCDDFEPNPPNETVPNYYVLVSCDPVRVTFERQF